MSNIHALNDQVKQQLNCVACGSNNINTRWENDSFQYGEGDTAPWLEAIVPVHLCGECGFEFTLSDADEIKHNAVCNHLGLLNPSQVKAVRDQHRLNRAEFARCTGIGEASLNRWEKGSLLQNAAMDNLIYLLSLPGNLEALFERVHQNDVPLSQKFQNIDISEEVLSYKEGFKL